MPTPGLSATLTEIESEMVLEGFTSSQIAAFAAYYKAAVAKDPAITPAQAYTAWAAGSAIAGGATATGNALGAVVNKGLPAAANAVPKVPGISTVSGLISALTSANTWIRVVKVVIGGVLLIVGLVHMTGVGGAAAGLARKVPLPMPI